MRSLIRAALVIALLIPPWTSASAQAKGKGLSRVDGYTGKIAWVIDRMGRTLLVRVVNATDSELVVTVGGAPQTIPVGEIARVFVEGDSVKDGTIIGGLIGIPLGILSCQGAQDGCDVIAHAIAGIALYGGIGALIDWHHHGRTVLYRAPGS